MQGEQLQCLHKIVSQGRVCDLRIVLALQLRFINPDEFLAFTGLLTKHVVSDAVEPGGKLSLAPEAADFLVSAQKCFLRKIICERCISAGKLTQQTPHARLMLPDKFRKGVVIIIEKNSCDEVGISYGHARRLYRRRNLVSVLLAPFELPNQKISDADQ